jgi:hypothetical protein
MRSDDRKLEIEKATDEPITMPEADSIQIIESGPDTTGDNRYPPVRRPPVYPIIMAPESPKQET